MRRLLPARFELRERLLFGLSLGLAGAALYTIFTAPPRTAPGLWMAWQFLGSLLFVVIAGRDRAYFTGLFCALLSGTQAIAFASVWVFRHQWSGWATELKGWSLVGFGLCLSVAVPVTFAWAVTQLITALERRFSK